MRDISINNRVDDRSYRTVPDAELMKFAQEYARDIAQNCSPASMQAMKRQVYESLEQTLSESHRKAVKLMHESFGRPDFAEGVSSFMQKRPPIFPRV